MASGALRRSRHRNAQNILPRPVILCWPRGVFCSTVRRSPNSIRCGAETAIGCPASSAFGGIADLNALAVSESVLDFLPGGLAAYWEEYRKLDAATMELVRRGLVGVFFVTTGPLHRAIHYHWHRSWPDWEKHHRALAESPAWRAFADGYRSRIVGSSVSYLRPSSVPWMRSLFESIDWSTN